MSLVQELHADHRKLVDVLVLLREAIEKRNISQVRTVLAGAERLLGTHLRFEEEHLYPALERVLGEKYAKKLINEDDRVIRSVERLQELSRRAQWTRDDVTSAEANLELLYEHPVACDGLSLWIERLSAGEQEGLYRQLTMVREEGTEFSDYRGERR